MPLVSVIMNVRNGAAFLREALDSVIAQSFEDWEVIVWDDCSSDGSAGIVSAYQDPRIHYFLSTEDTPLGAARNSAIQRASGEWLAFLDQDDVWLANKLERQMTLADNRTGIIYGRTMMFDARGDRREYDYIHEFTALPEGDIFVELFQHACFIAMSSAVLRRSAVMEVGGIPDTIQVVPDYYLYVAIARHYRARAVQDIVCRYRVHAGSMSRTNRHRLHQEPLSIIQQWAGSLDPRLAAYRRKTFSTVLALEEMRSAATFTAGLRRLFAEGSPTWLLARPMVIAGRFLRRKLRRAYRPDSELASRRD